MFHGRPEGPAPVDDAVAGSDTQDHAAIASVRAGDPNAFRFLVERYHRPLYAFVAATNLPPDQVDDLVQQAFVNAYVGLDRFDCRRAFLPWLKTIARNLVVDHLRKRRRRDSWLDDYRYNVLQQLVDQEDDEHRQRALASCIDRLPTDGREALRLRYEEDLDMSDVGQRIGRTASATQRFLSRLRAQLRDCIDRNLRRHV